MKYKNYNVFIQTGVYENKRIAIQIMDADDYCPIATATVNVDNVSMKVDETAIKNYSENEGMLEWLKQNEIVQEVVRYTKIHWVLMEDNISIVD